MIIEKMRVVLIDTLDEFLRFTEMGIPCKQRTIFKKQKNDNNSNKNNDNNNNNDDTYTNDSTITNQFIREYMKQTFSKEKWNAYDQLNNEQKNMFLNDWKLYPEDRICMAWKNCKGNIQQISSYIKNDDTIKK